MAKAKKKKDEEGTLTATLTKWGTRRNSKDVAVQIKMKDEEEDEKLQEPQVSNKKKKRNTADIDGDDGLFEKELSSDEIKKYDSDDSDISINERPWAKQANEKNSTSPNKTTRGTFPKNITSPKDKSENSIPKKKRSMEDLTEPSEATIPKKKRETEEPDAIELLTEIIPDKNREPDIHDRPAISEPISTLTGSLGKNPLIGHEPALLGHPILPPSTGDWSRPKTHPDVIKGSAPPSLSVDKVPTNNSTPKPDSVQTSTKNNVLKDLNHLINLVYSDMNRSRSTSLETVDMFGTFLNRSNQESLDFFDRDDKGNVVIQPKIPIFPEDFAPGQKPAPLSWWGIVTPSEWVLKHHYPPIPTPVESQPEKTENRDGGQGMNYPRYHVDGRRSVPTHVGQRPYDRDRVGARPYWPTLQGNHHPDTMTNYHHSRGRDHPSHGSYGGGGPEWNRNFRDDNWKRNQNEHPHP